MENKEITELREDVEFYKSIVKNLLQQQIGKFFIMDENILSELKDEDVQKLMDIARKCDITISEKGLQATETNCKKFSRIAFAIRREGIGYEVVEKDNKIMGINFVN